MHFINYLSKKKTSWKNIFIEGTKLEEKKKRRERNRTAAFLKTTNHHRTANVVVIRLSILQKIWEQRRKSPITNLNFNFYFCWRLFDSIRSDRFSMIKTKKLFIFFKKKSYVKKKIERRRSSKIRWTFYFNRFGLNILRKIDNTQAKADNIQK